MKPILCCLTLLLMWTAATQAIQLGEQAGPVQLFTLDGTSLVMTNYSERRGTVLLFLSARSTAAQNEAAVLNKLNARVRLRGILLVGVFSVEDESSDEVRQFAQGHGFMFPVYRDREKRAAQQLGITVTPESCLLNGDGVLLYRGGLIATDDSPLEKAVDAFLDGTEIKQFPALSTPLEKMPTKSLSVASEPVAFSSELIFETIPNVPAHHCSTLTEAANGDLLALWYGGSFESSDDQTLFLSRRKKGERIWARPEVLIRNASKPPGNAVIFSNGRSRLFIVWARMEASRPLRRGGGWGNTRLLYRTSDDQGATWSEDQLFLDGLFEGLRNVPIILTNGALLLPLGHSFAASHDHGQNWEHLGAVNGGGQPTVIQRSDGTLLTLLRKRPWLMQSESVDGAKSWSSTIATELKNPDAGIAMTRLRSGHLLLVFNNSDNARTPLSIARSINEGKSWETPLTLESNPGEYSYPCIIQASDGRIHITYTYRRCAIKHVEINERWLTDLHPPN